MKISVLFAYRRNLASPRYNSSKLGSTLGLHKLSVLGYVKQMFPFWGFWNTPFGSPVIGGQKCFQFVSFGCFRFFWKRLIISVYNFKADSQEEDYDGCRWLYPSIPVPVLSSSTHLHRLFTLKERGMFIFGFPFRCFVTGCSFLQASPHRWWSVGRPLPLGLRWRQHTCDTLHQP